MNPSRWMYKVWHVGRDADDRPTRTWAVLICQKCFDPVRHGLGERIWSTARCEVCQHD